MALYIARHRAANTGYRLGSDWHFVFFKLAFHGLVSTRYNASIPLQIRNAKHSG